MLKRLFCKKISQKGDLCLIYSFKLTLFHHPPSHLHSRLLKGAVITPYRVISPPFLRGDFHPAFSFYCMYDKFQAAMLHSRYSSSLCKMINVKIQNSWLPTSYRGSSYAPWSKGVCLCSALLRAQVASRQQTHSTVTHKILYRHD